MFKQETQVFIEFPPDIIQQDLWNLEEKLQQIEGIEVELHESKDIFATAILVLQVSTSIMGSVAIISGGIKSVQEVTKILFDFLHHSNDKNDSKKRIIITKKGKKVEIYNLSFDEIEKLLSEK